MTKNSFSGFTLVELIVVITILVILGTIAFVSLGGFSGSARDSSRMSDLSLLSKGLDIYFVKNGNYPDPTSSTGIAYSGGTVWKQGTVGDSVVLSLGWIGARVSKKPTDPLSSSEYAYSITTESKEYALKSDYEGNSVSFRSFPTAYAETGNPTIAYVKGNYNGVAAKVTVGSSPRTVYLLSVPNIFTAASSTGVTVGVNQSFITNGSNNTGGVSFIPKIIYSSGSLPTNDTEKALFASGIVSVYSGTALASSTTISSFIQASGNTGTLANLWGGLQNRVWGGVSVSAATSSAPSGPDFVSILTTYLSGAITGGSGASTFTSGGYSGSYDAFNSDTIGGSSTSQTYEGAITYSSDITNTSYAISSSITVGSAGNLFDQNWVTEGDTANNPNNSYFWQDFWVGNLKHIRRVGMWAANVNRVPSSIAVQYADNPAGPWTTVNSFSPTSPPSGMEYYNLSASGPHRCWRVLQTGATTGAWYDFSVYSMEMNEAISIQAFYDNTNGSYTADVTSTTNAIANTGTPANAFDNDAINTYWDVSNAPGTSWIGQDFGVSNTKHIRQVRISCQNVNRYATQMKLQSAGNIWGPWADIAVLNGTVAEQSPGSYDSFAIPYSAPARYWRLLQNATTGWAGYNWDVQEMEMMESSTPTNMTLLSGPITPIGSPSNINIIVLWKDMSWSATINTDLKIEASRDGGSTWTFGTLQDTGLTVSGYKILSATISPTGTTSTIKYRITTLNNKLQQVKWVGMMWW